jgi:hypothetical protein
MKYEAPELDIIELDAVDIIQTSGDSWNDNETPLSPANVMDSTY